MNKELHANEASGSAQGLTNGSGALAEPPRPRGFSPKKRSAASRSSAKTELMAASDDVTGTPVAWSAPSAAGTDRETCAEVAAPSQRSSSGKGRVSERKQKPRERDGSVKDHDAEAVVAELEEIPGGDEPLAADALGFVDAMHARIDLYEVGKRFLQSQDEKIRQRAWEFIVELRYRKGATAQAEETPIIDFSGLPRPLRS